MTDRKGHLVNRAYRLNLRIERDRHSESHLAVGALGRSATQGLSIAGAGFFGLLFILGLQLGLRQLGNNTAFGSLVVLLSFASVGVSQQLLAAMVIGGGGNGLLAARSVASRILKRPLPSLKDDPNPTDGVLQGVTNYTKVPGRVMEEESDDDRRGAPAADTPEPAVGERGMNPLAPAEATEP